MINHANNKKNPPTIEEFLEYLHQKSITNVILVTIPKIFWKALKTCFCVAPVLLPHALSFSQHGQINLVGERHQDVKKSYVVVFKLLGVMGKIEWVHVKKQWVMFQICDTPKDREDNLVPL